MVEDGLENVRTENVYVPTWVRGNESAVMLQPRYKKLGMLGLGGSIATPPVRKKKLEKKVGDLWIDFGGMLKRKELLEKFWW